ncbi:MAG: M48 family metalloprotease [Steroidobacteraceae bacterium]
MKRIFLFLATNIAVLAILTDLVGLDRWLAVRGGGPGALLVVAAFFGVGGAFVSLLMSQWMARRAMGVRANIIVMAFSRWREFRADRGGAHLAGIPNMIAALEALKRAHEPLPSRQFASFGITSGRFPGQQVPRKRGSDMARGLQRLFMSRPPFDERIAALRALTVA